MLNMKSSDELTLYGIDIEYKRSVHQLIKITNQKLNQLNENKINRDKRTTVKLYASFLKVGEIGK